MQILLFDLDGVLIEPRAYYLALQETVALIGRGLGYREAALSQEDIQVFESVGVSSEWDSAAICAALLLRRAWTVSHEYHLPTKLPLPRPPPHELAVPNFREFFESMGRVAQAGTQPLLLAERQLLSDDRLLTAAQASELRSCLRNARRAEHSVTYCLFQEFVLGSDLYRQIYGLPPHLNSTGHLLTQDRPLLSENVRQELQGWLMQPGHHAAVFTKRPSHGPQDSMRAPEAELGLKVIDLEQLPVVGTGGTAWLAARRGEEVDAFMKPSAVHALAAIRLAIGSTLETALKAAAALELDGYADAGWLGLASATIRVFEDSAEGLFSARSAQHALQRAGIDVEVALFGISDSAPKRQALESISDELFPSLEHGLRQHGVLVRSKCCRAAREPASGPGRGKRRGFDN
ncbi:MAG: hypothetical protein BMS9Abin28_1637 [Anaerolineae bacterium]|nr:MAG: hypothetical protein BMS9Abin28_1637 [Anaerolineae bacterium]